MFKFISCGLLLAATTAAHAANPWTELALTDLDFVYQTVRDNHPGPVDSANPGFRTWMEQGYVQAKADAAKARSLGDAQSVLRRYFAGFADGHLWLNIAHSPNKVRWTGMVLQRQGQRYRIASSEDPRVPAGAELLSCDGRAIDAIIDADLAPQVFNDPQQDWVKTYLASNVLTLDGALTHAEFARCTFVVKGQAREHTLQWRDVFQHKLSALLEKAEPDLGKDSTITELRPGHFWVRLPQFQPNDEQVKQINRLTARMPSLRQAKLIVFDTRGNQGGSSVWGKQVLEALYGAAYMQQQDRDAGYAMWRVSKDNLDYLRDDMLPYLIHQHGADHPDIAVWTSLKDRMTVAMGSGEQFVRQSVPAQPAATAQAAQPATATPLTRARIALVTQSGCGSACLDFADAVLSIPGAVHLGEITGTDTVYMEGRRAYLPSGLGRFMLPQKVYRDRQRGHNVAYTPHIRYEGDIHDSKTLQTWVLHQLNSPATMVKNK